MATNFPTRSRRDDQYGHKVVEANLDFLRDVFDKAEAKRLGGTATIAVGATSIVVTHGLGNGNFQVAITPLADPTVRYWVTAKSSTSFTISLSAAAPAGGVAFDWILRGF